MINNQALFVTVVLSFSIRLHGNQGKNTVRPSEQDMKQRMI